ncbi:hypothetical protein Aduo_017124 [Ancylostoma duodenale]
MTTAPLSARPPRKATTNPEWISVHIVEQTVTCASYEPRDACGDGGGSKTYYWHDDEAATLVGSAFDDVQKSSYNQ